jgi:nucleotide-binding universal stress UspA family protein
MAFTSLSFKTALQDFRNARQQAALQEIIGWLTGRRTQLLSFDEVAKKLRLTSRSDRGVQPIPVNAIIGSVGRYTDFTRTFLPRQKEDEQRWARVKAVTDKEGIQAIDVYKVGEVYFVLDGNHRVSIARREGMEFIDANVIDVKTPVPLTPDTQPDDLIIKAEYAEFLEQTHLSELRPNVDVTLTAPGQYKKLMEQIQIQLICSSQEKGCDVNFEEAVLNWYDEYYLPMAQAICERGLLRWFPKRTVADLVLWVSEHREELEKELGWSIRSDAAVTDLAVSRISRAQSQEEAVGTWRQKRLVDRYTENLFRDILVPFSGSSASWCTVEQAMAVAAREDAHVFGLHIVKSAKSKDTVETRHMKARFDELCRTAGVDGSFLVEAGDITDKICKRALLADLVVLNSAHPPAEGISGLGSGLRSIVWHCARPLLTVNQNVSCMDQAMLAFDGSPKSKEALFVATYMAEKWMTRLKVVAVIDGDRVLPSVLDYPRAYLDLHEVDAEFILTGGPIDVLHQLMDEHNINILIMGGYSVPVLQEVMGGGSAVNFILRENHCPIFICR